MKAIHPSIQHRLQPVARLCLLTLAILSAALAGMGGSSTAAAQAPASQVASMMNGLLLYLSLDGPPGACSFMDWSGNGHDSVAPSGACPTSGQPGRFFEAAAFDGVYNSLHSANHPSLEFGSAQDFTVLLWMKSGSLRSWDALISTKEWWGGTKSGFILSIDSSGSQWTANAADGTNRSDAYSNGPLLSDNQWHHLAVTFDRDGQMVMYQDGAQVGSASMAGVGSINSGLPIVMGNTYAAEEPYAGLLDDIMIYNRVLTPAEIAALMQGDCTVSDGGDSGENTLRGKLADNTCHTIYFANDYTIPLAQPLANGRDVTVDGSGHNIVISGSSSTRVLSNSGYQVTLINLTIRDGRLNTCSTLDDGAGAGIYHHGHTNTGSETLTLVNCTVANNHNDACYGGGIFNDGVILKLVNSTIRDNYGFWGGGVFDFGGSTTIINSTLAGNHAFALGGGVSTTVSKITIDNSSLVNNRADGNSGAGGGGIYSRNEEDVITVRNTLIAGSPAGGNCAGWAFDAGATNNLADDGTCGSGFNSSSSILLGALGNYGGSTPTFPLLPGSAAIDAGDPTVCAASDGVNHLDQRGRARPASSCDIGAFESQGFNLAVTGGDQQSAVINTAFAQPLALGITANDPGEPLDGGMVAFSGPSSGASTNPVTNTAIITGGAASLAVTANGSAGGPYTVAAGTAGASAVNFNLTNDKETAIVTLSSLEHTYDRTPKSATVTTDPAGLDVEITYDGSAAPPTAAGEFAVVATVNDLSYRGSVTGTLLIARAAVTVTGITAADKVYDGGLAAALDTSGAALSGVISGDEVTLEAGGAAGAFADKHVGIDKPVTISGLALGGADAGNYTLTPAAATASITPRPLTVSGIAAADKVYDGGVAAAFDASNAILNGVISGDDVTLEAGNAVGAFADKHAGIDKLVTISGLALGGADAGDYTLNPTSTAFASITPRPLTVSGITAADKVYDGGLAAALDTSGAALNGVISGDDVTLDAGSAAGAFTDKHVGIDKLVAISGLALGGAGAADYTLTPAAASADITPCPLTVSGVAAIDKVYDGSLAAALDAGSATLNGLISGDDVTLDAGSAVGVFADKHVGIDKPVAISGLTLSGAGAGDYTLSTTAAAFASITPRPLTVTAGEQSKVYGTPDPAFTVQVTAGSLAAGDSLSGEPGRAAGENAGVYAITQGTLTAGSDYALTFVSADLIIIQAPASLFLSSLDQIYTGTPRAVAVTTDPPGLAGVKVLYAGSPDAPLDAGSYELVVSLSNINYQAQAVTGTLAIAKADAGAVLQVSASSVSAGQMVTLTLTLSPTASVANLPTGEITFMDGSAVLGTALLANTGSSVQAVLSISSLSAGEHLLSAGYTGDENFSASASNTVLLTVVADGHPYAIYLPVLQK